MPKVGRAAELEEFRFSEIGCLLLDLITRLHDLKEARYHEVVKTLKVPAALELKEEVSKDGTQSTKI